MFGDGGQSVQDAANGQHLRVHHEHILSAEGEPAQWRMVHYISQHFGS